MSTPSEDHPPAGSTGPAQSSTQEIPVVAPAATRTTVQQLPPPSAPAHRPAATAAPAGTPAPAPADPPPAPQATGPVGFVPGPPGAGSPPPAPATAPGPTATWPESPGTGATAPGNTAEPEPRAPRDRTALAGAGLVLLSLVLLQLGLVPPFGGESAWSAVPLWSSFATLCVALGLGAVARLLPGGRRPAARTGRRVAVGGLTGLAVFWVLVVLPGAATDRGFLLTAALGALGGALRLTTDRDG
ncbi:hypothetical protein [Blastococcus montanus]|uniref:hypothetical protein n=1 Tax=Blastococcus montanus TaxID=3144973 RepID=UPI0032091B5D